MPDKMGDETQTLTVPDLEKASQEDLQDILSKSDEELADQLMNPGATPPPADKTGEQQPASSTAATPTGIEIDLGNGKKINFKDQSELLERFAVVTKSHESLVGKYGQTLDQLRRLSPLEGEVNKLKTQLQELQKGGTQVAAGQQPTAITPATVKAAAKLGIDLTDVSPENFNEKVNAFGEAIEGKITALETGLEQKISERVKVIEDRNKALEEKFGKIEGDLSYQQQLTVYDRHLNNLLGEISGLQAKVGDVIKTQWPVADINKLISDSTEKYGDAGVDIAKAKLPPGDFEKWEIIESLLSEDYCPVDAQGNIDITQRKLKNINAAWAAFITDHPELAPTDVARAQAAGAKQVVETIKTVASQPPRIPNNMATQTGATGMTQEVAEKLIQTPAAELNKWKKTKDPRYQQYLAAQEFISNLTEVPQ